MKLILTTDVPGLGGPGDIVEVRDGYGRNFLLRRNLAVAAGKGAEAEAKRLRDAATKRYVHVAVAQFSGHPRQRIVRARIQ